MDLTQLENRIKQIEIKLATIEGQLSENSPPRSKPILEPISESLPLRQKVAPTPVNSSGLNAPLSTGNLLAIVAIICFIVATGFIIKLSIDSGWLNPTRQIGLALVFGLSLIMSGLSLLKYDKEYSSYLPAAGIIVLYLSIFAAHQYYFLISFKLALTLTSAISAFCIGLYWRIKHDIYPLVAAIGAYLAPLALGLNTSELFTLYYFVPCSLAFAIISIWVESRLLSIISAYLALITTGWIGYDIGREALIASLLAIHFFIFSFGIYLYSYQNRRFLTYDESWSLFPVLLVFYVLEFYFIQKLQPNIAPTISLIFAFSLIILYLTAEKWFPKQSLNSKPMILAYTTIVCFHSVYLELLPADIKPWIFVVIVLATALTPSRVKFEKSSPYIFPLIALWIILIIEFLSMMTHLLMGWNFNWFIVSMVSFASLWFLLITKDTGSQSEYGYTLLTLAHILGITGLYRFFVDSGSLAVSASWLFYAVIVIIFAWWRKDKTFAQSAVIILGFAAGKALLYDAASASPTLRIICLLLTGMVLYGGGFFIKKISEWK